MSDSEQTAWIEDEPGADERLKQTGGMETVEQQATEQAEADAALAHEDAVLEDQPPLESEPLPEDDGGPTGEPKPPEDPATRD